MKEMIVQLITALLGSFGFALMFQLRKGLLLAASIGGLLNWGVYLLMQELTGAVFISCFVAAAAAAIYCEITARVLKAPVTLFLVPAIVPSVPGSSLFYTMSSIVQNDWPATKHFGLLTAKFALGIAAGICVSVVLFSIMVIVRRK